MVAIFWNGQRLHWFLTKKQGKAEGLLKNVIIHHRVPLELHSDEGWNFKSEIWEYDFDGCK